MCDDPLFCLDFKSRQKNIYICKKIGASAVHENMSRVYFFFYSDSGTSEKEVFNGTTSFALLSWPYSYISIGRQHFFDYI